MKPTLPPYRSYWKPASGGGWNLVNANSGKYLEITAGALGALGVS
ncbi:hypothetical protein ACIRO3_35250 [Streptomyces sp. NPDC102278]